ncbi:ATP-binding sensor histidine kinase [Nostoc sp. TCL26-01]|uniref:trifunctional serine/threonine-protein kinase/ATP-binding protein/sensor histidine kinase n=1 Tax=Nostoc sp. TCL26-01 TaxID=2576904 RepID=UPI0015C04EC2|nr:ATP-binding sensor histidine kinase [Nostoc sp. TCL26-01]QLE56613.1 GAF domain-containing protein [Nostoc sp. TCL26-01]
MTVSLDTKFFIPGYHLTEQIYSGSKTLVYRGIREQDQMPVVLKLMRSEYPSANEIAQFRNQYNLAKNLNHPGIVKLLSLDNYANSCVLVMEDFGGISLKEWQERSPLPLKEFFHIAIATATILEGLHSDRIIHKDIKPANILINPHTLEIKLIDFSIATLLPREVPCIVNPNVLEGTLAYISPEQTGRMNRGIDYRSDFYSLGITFFELLTGHLPFISNDPMELVYCHIAKTPNTLQNRAGIPQAIADIVMKLLAKNAEDRYQSAYGLRYDLERCYQQWENIGDIVPFELGTQDISDQFLIPEKLYGRQREVEILLTAFDRVTQGKTEMVLVAGFSGIGKTAVVNEVHKPIARQRSYFIKGKFDQFQRDIPLSGLVQALRDLIAQILSEPDAQIQRWQTKILSVLGEQAQIIIDVIPELELVIGQQPKVSELVGCAAENRFYLLLQEFIQVFTSNKRPLVIFLDDLQWADTASLKLIQLLMSQTKSCLSIETTEQENKENRNILLIGAYRDNEVFSSHPLELTIQEIYKTGATIHTITLAPLTQNDLTNLITDVLRCHNTLTIHLSQIVFSKTQGNPFFIHQFLKCLHQDQIISFNHHLGHWQCDMSQIKTLALTDDVVEFMKIQLMKLPPSTQKVLQLAACIGNQFDLNTLAIVYEKSLGDTVADLWIGVVEGIILPQAEVYRLLDQDYKSEEQQLIGNSSTVNWENKASTHANYQSSKCQFIHDRVQQAAYNSIPENHKQSIHWQIGKLLVNNTPITEREDKIFEIVNQLNIAIPLILNQPYDIQSIIEERYNLAQMNLIAGTRALASTAYLVAIKCLTTGIDLLTNDSWENHYQLTLDLYTTAAEAAYLNGSLSQMEKFIEVVLLKANNILDTVKVYELKIQAYGSQNKALAAVDIALNFVKLLDVNFPNNPTPLDIENKMETTRNYLAGRQIEDLIHLPKMTAAEPLAIMQILSSAVTFFYQAAPEIMPLVCFKQINLSLQYGNSPLSAFVYGIYGFMLCGVMGDIDSGYKFGNLALNLVANSHNLAAKTKIVATYNSHISHWKEHIKSRFPYFLETYSQALAVGDLEFAALSLQNYTLSAYFSGRELAQLQPEIAKYSNYISHIKQERVLLWNNIYHQTVLNLLGGSENTGDLTGEAYDEAQGLKIHLAANDGIGLLYLYFCKAQIHYLLANYYQARENIQQAEKYLHGGLGSVVFPQVHFYYSLVALALYDETAASEQQAILNKVVLNQEKMQQWAHHCPMNYLHKFYLVEAEYHRVLGNFLIAMDNYDRAITLAQENEYINEAALAYELAAKFYLELGRYKIAQTYLTDAYYSYSRWGALAKVADLQTRYPQLLTLIIQQEKLKTQPISHNITDSITNTLSQPSTHATVLSSHTSISDLLDLATVVKASQALSGEIELKQLLSTLMQVVMENAGASKSVLILSKGDKLKIKVAAINSSENFGEIQTTFPSENIELSREVPNNLINYVKRTREIFVTDDAKQINFLASDRYVIEQQPQSLLCIPIVNQGKFLGILYLENDLTTGAFTSDRIEILKLLTTQAAISLENAILYENLARANQELEEYNHTLEAKVESRTQELHENNQHLQQALQNLQYTQTQLVQSEKMSSLGQMVAGIAHEINNPINFIHGNISHASEYVKSLLELMAIYQQEYPHPAAIIEEKSEEIDINFLVVDLPKILDSMKMGSTRIRNIVIGLRNFSRLDESDMKPVDIHEGIDNTLMILQHRIKYKNDRPEITVIKEYAQIPAVNCYASQMNQVFMNILSNAIDAVEESVFNHPLTYKPTIRICTELTDSHNLRIRIIDNGLGIKEAVKQKIFDPFFTTKPVGSGTGLGLSISYQIVAEKHKGTLSCNSTLGQGTEFVIEIPGVAE